MDRTLISWSVPNLVTIWLMFAIGFLVLGLGVQLAGKYWPGQSKTASTAGGY